MEFKYNSKLFIKIKESGITQVELAKKIGIQPYELSYIISGRMNPKEEEIKALSKALKCEISEIFDE